MRSWQPKDWSLPVPRPPAISTTARSQSTWREDFRPTDRVHQSELPACEAAVTLHTGPYEKLPDAYSALTEWIKENGKHEAGPPWEVYVTDPGGEPDSSKWQTEVVWPVS